MEIVAGHRVCGRRGRSWIAIGHRERLPPPPHLMGTWVAEQGVADLNTGEPVTAEMAWPLRSLTKSVVATVLLQQTSTTTGSRRPPSTARQGRCSTAAPCRTGFLEVKLRAARRFAGRGVRRCW